MVLQKHSKHINFQINIKISILRSTVVLRSIKILVPNIFITTHVPLSMSCNWYSCEVGL